VALFRRREPLHERLAREGGLVPREPRQPWQEVGIHGLQRPREWDATVTADATAADGEQVTFVALADRTLLLEDGDVSDASGLADAVEQELPAPYRARAMRTPPVWVIQARRIEVLELPEAPGGDALDLAKTLDGRPELSVDGQQVFGTVRALEERGGLLGPEYAVHAERLDGDLWEVRAAAL
jgi:hypothetical protein